jgi:putative endonuclease
VRRVREHKEKRYPNGFTARYSFNRLVYYEPLVSFDDALRRERYLKGLLRSKKVSLIQANNPNWLDLSASWTDLYLIT